MVRQGSGPLSRHCAPTVSAEGRLESLQRPVVRPKGSLPVPSSSAYAEMKHQRKQKQDNAVDSAGESNDEQKEVDGL